VRHGEQERQGSTSSPARLFISGGLSPARAGVYRVEDGACLSETGVRLFLAIAAVTLMVLFEL
jgi:hypothetical protein